jgi:ribonucleoside-diphosphate reductase alpha chain
LWAKILKTRNEIGYPYILFEENCNKNCPQVYIDKDMWIDNANMCIEAIEYCDDEKEFACCLSSVNLVHFDEWKTDPYFLMDCSVMLDCVITEYIEKGSNLPGLEKAIKFAKEHRSTGLGVIGFHDYLQKNNIVFGSLESYQINNELFKLMREKCDDASKWMGSYWGEPEIMKGYGMRNTSRLAIAPTKSTSFIMGKRSLGIEPIKSNYHEKDLAKIQIDYKNPQLEELLEQKGKNTKEVWRSILINNGSVQHLDFLSEHEKDVFKTFSEVSQMDVIKLAAQRQQYIDMGQSINVMIHPKTPAKDINKLYLAAYEEGIKSLYYQYSINAAQELNRDLMTCTACEG